MSGALPTHRASAGPGHAAPGHLASHAGAASLLSLLSEVFCCINTSTRAWVLKKVLSVPMAWGFTSFDMTRPLHKSLSVPSFNVILRSCHFLCLPVPRSGTQVRTVGPYSSCLRARRSGQGPELPNPEGTRTQKSHEMHSWLVEGESRSPVSPRPPGSATALPAPSLAPVLGLPLQSRPAGHSAPAFTFHLLFCPPVTPL